MSIQNEINRIAQNVADAYNAADEMGAALPPAQNIFNLAATILSIPQSGGLGIKFVGGDTDNLSVDLYPGDVLTLRCAQSFDVYINADPNDPESYTDQDSIGGAGEVAILRGTTLEDEERFDALITSDGWSRTYEGFDPRETEYMPFRFDSREVNKVPPLGINPGPPIYGVIINKDKLGTGAGEFPWVFGRFQDRSLTANVNTEITPGLESGDNTLISGNYFVAKAPGLYALSVSGVMAAASSTITSYIMPHDINGVVGNAIATATTFSGARIQGVTGIKYLLAGESLGFQVLSAVNQTSTGTSTFTFARIA